MELVVIREEPVKAVVKCEVEGNRVIMECSLDTYGELKKAGEMLNKSRRLQREYKTRRTGKVNKARKAEIVFE